ncbi:barstar family protein [Streptomyces sp. 24-1644]|uniref:barstar family protein n=1 Tax=Streptomyces sp. 24-1644 TaxID=3457315 RepID=UPI003FA72DCE
MYARHHGGHAIPPTDHTQAHDTLDLIDAGGPVPYDGYFDRNLDPFADCLSGGMGIPDDAEFVIEWRDHAQSARALGHPETARYLRRTAERAHPTSRVRLEADLTEALAGRGPTLFDRLVEIIRERTGPGSLRLT